MTGRCSFRLVQISRLVRLLMMCGAAGLCGAIGLCGVSGRCEAAGLVGPPLTAPLPVTQDEAARMTIPVMVNGQGPFAFVVDTGADRTVISSALAAALKLPAGRRVRLHDVGGSAEVQTVVLDSLAFGGRATYGVEAPVLEAADLGAPGMLGIDSLRGQQVTMDFRAGTFAAGPSRTEADTLPGAIIVIGRRRYGQLVLVDAEANGVPVFVILDTGAQNTLGNAALQRLLTAARDKTRPPDADVISVTGTHSPARVNEIEEMRLGDILVRHLPIAYADLETFRQFGLTERPAMLLGMDVLHMFRSVSVDFLRREAAFVPR